MEWTRGEVIGRGTSGTVYVGHFSGGHVLAVKSAEMEKSQTLQREHQMVSSLGVCDCPYILSYYTGDDVSKERNNVKKMFNLFMEYVPAGDIAGTCLTEEGIRHYVWQILKGLEHLHSLGFAHCDIKGSNILLTETGVRICDFGYAKRVGSDSTSRGSPAYMAPEVVLLHDQGFAADVWALGCTVVEMATGKPPWHGALDPGAVLYRVGFSGDSPEIPSRISDEGRDFLGKCFVKDPRRRWTAGQLLKHPFVIAEEVKQGKDDVAAAEGKGEDAEKLK